MIVPSEGWSRPPSADILPSVRRKLLEGLARSARRAVLLTTLCLVVALGIGVGGFAASSGASHALASALAATETPAAQPAPSSLVRSAPPVVAAVHAAPAPAVSQQPFETTRALTVAEPPAAGTPEDVVRATRLITPSTPIPDLNPGDRVKATVSFYYCELGATSPARGDGGGFCGAMRDGSIVYNGAAACDYAYLGQRFRIEGDPLGRVYRCADTGSAVHGLHRDIWFGSSDEGWQWQRSVGQSATIEILP